MARTILCIDDDRETCGTLESGLAEGDYELLHTDDPQQALRLLGHRSPDLVVMEILLRKGDGLDLIEAILSREEGASATPVVVVTRAVRSPVLYGRAVELGVRDYLVKPVLDSQLLDTVREFAEPEAPGHEIDVSTASQDDPQEISLSGELADVPTPELLHRLHQAGVSGVLMIESAKQRAGIQFRNGSPVAVSSHRGIEPFEDYLLRTKRISAEQREALINQVTFEVGSVREILVGMGALDDDEIEAVQQEQAESQLFESFRWTTGQYRFRPGRALKTDTATELVRDSGSILLKGVLEYSPRDQIAALLRERGELYPFRGECPAYLVDEMELTPEQERLLEGMDGEQPLSETIDGVEENERLLYAFIVTGLIELQDEPVLLLEDVVSVKASGAPRPDASSQGAPEAEAAAASGSDRPETTGPEGADGASRSLEAESWFRKGEGFLKRKQFAKAVEAYGMSSHLDPKEGIYVAHLGYALYLSNPNDRLVQREALEHVAKGIKLSPEREKPYIFLGKIFKATGEEKTAQKMFRRALQIKPGCHEALQEMRLSKLRAEKSKGLMGRLRGK